MEEWWISTVGVQKWCPQPRPWQSLRPQRKLMQSTAVLNFAKSKNMKEKKKRVSHFWQDSHLLVLLLACCHLPSSDSYKEAWKTSLISTSPRPLIVQWFGDTCRKGEIGFSSLQAQEETDFRSLFGSLQNTAAVPRAMVCALQLRWRVWSRSASTDTVALTGVTATCPRGWESVPSCLWPTEHILHISTLLTTLQTLLIQYWVFVKDQPGA